VEATESIGLGYKFT